MSAGTPASGAAERAVSERAARPAAAVAAAEPRWTIRIDGDVTEIVLRPTASPWVWIPTILCVPVPFALACACAWLARWIVRYAFPVHGAYEWFGLVFGAGALSLAAIWCLRIAVKEMGWMLWIWTGVERTTLRRDDVRIERTGFGIDAAATFPRGQDGPGAAIDVAPRPLLGDVLSLRWGLPRLGTSGALRVAGPPCDGAASRGIRFGLDLSPAEAAAILTEIALIRAASARGRV